MLDRLVGRRSDPVAQLLAGVLLTSFGLLVGAWIALNYSDVDGGTLRRWTPTVSAALAALALVLSAFTYARTARRTRQALTYEAWGRWSDGTRKGRRQTRDRHAELSEELSKTLAGLTGKAVGSAASADERKLALDAHRISLYLGGMERLGAGWRRGLYDLDELDELGATIIIRLYRRHESYVRAIRADKNQPSAYTSFQALALELEKRHPDL